MRRRRCSRRWSALAGTAARAAVGSTTTRPGSCRRPKRPTTSSLVVRRELDELPPRARDGLLLDLRKEPVDDLASQGKVVKPGVLAGPHGDFLLQRPFHYKPTPARHALLQRLGAEAGIDFRERIVDVYDVRK